MSVSAGLPEDSDQREFARIEVCIAGWIRPVDVPEAEPLRLRMLERPSVWAPTNEATLRDMSAGAAGPEALLAEAVLELTSQIVRLRAQLRDRSPEQQAVTISQLSGGGGKLETPTPISKGDLLELRLDDDDDDVPPIRALIRIVHCYRSSPGSYGFRFEAIHPLDQDRLIRLIYQLQRLAIRRAHMEEEDDED